MTKDNGKTHETKPYEAAILAESDDKRPVFLTLACWPDDSYSTSHKKQDFQAFSLYYDQIKGVHYESGKKEEDLAIFNYPFYLYLHGANLSKLVEPIMQRRVVELYQFHPEYDQSPEADEPVIWRTQCGPNR